MARKRPCRICRRWFSPHPRAGDRQTVCSSPACQHERHRRSCASWHARNPDYDKENYLHRRIHGIRSWKQADNADSVVESGLSVEEPTIESRKFLSELDWSAVRDAVGLQLLVVIEEASKVLERSVRDAVILQLQLRYRDTRRLPPKPLRDDIDTFCNSP